MPSAAQRVGIHRPVHREPGPEQAHPRASDASCLGADRLGDVDPRQRRVGAATSSHARWAELSGQIRKSAAGLGEQPGGVEHDRREGASSRRRRRRASTLASGIESIVTRGWSCLPTRVSASRQIVW